MVKFPVLVHQPGSSVATDAELDRRRDIALPMAREGFTQTSIAKKLNVEQPTVSRWVSGIQRSRASKSTLKPEETGASEEKPQIGRAPFLTVEQLSEIKDQRPGYRWTGREFAAAIFDAFGVRYSLSHSCTLLACLRPENSGATRFNVSRSIGSGK